MTIFDRVALCIAFAGGTGSFIFFAMTSPLFLIPLTFLGGYCWLLLEEKFSRNKE